MSRQYLAATIGEFRPLASEIFAIVVIVAMCIFTLYHAMDIQTFWVDEAYSLLLTSNDIPRMIDLTMQDAHPPLYYLLLKTWLKLGVLLGIPEMIFWPRFLSFFPYVGMLLVAWIWGARRIDRSFGALLAAMLSTNALLVFSAHDARMYAFTVLGVYIAFLCVVEACFVRRRMVEGSRWVVLWIVYVAATQIALWTHLLTTFALFGIGLLWLLGLAADGWRNRGYTLGGLIANIVAICLYSPWLVTIRQQHEHVKEADTWWMWTADLGGLLYSMTFAPIAGRHANTSWDIGGVPYVILIVCIFLPMVAWGVATILRGRDRKGRDPLSIIAACSLGLYVFFGVGTWAVSSMGWAKTFGAERYIQIVLPMMITALLAACFLLSEWFGKRVLLVVFLAPWFCTALVANLIQANVFLTGSPHFRPTIDAAIAAAKVPPKAMIITPTRRLQPYINTMIPEREVHCILDVNADEIEGPVLIMLYGYHSALEGPFIQAFHVYMVRQLLEDKIDIINLPVGVEYSTTQMVRLLPQQARDLINETKRIYNGGVVTTAIPHDAASAATPLALSDGLHLAERDGSKDYYAWSGKPSTTLTFRGAIAPGRYRIVVVLHREPYPNETESVTFRIDNQQFSLDLGPGYHYVAREIDISRRLRIPKLQIEHPVWRPIDFVPGSTDDRDLGFLFMGAWFEKME